MKGMKKRHTIPYILSDWLSATLVWFLFNLLRFQEIAQYDGFGTLEAYLTNRSVWQGQISGFFSMPCRATTTTRTASRA